MEPANPVLIIGCGDIGGRVAALCLARGRVTSAMARSPASAARLQRRGILPASGDLDDPVSLASLPSRKALVYYFAPPPAEGETDPRMAGFLVALQKEERPERIVYISTSGVYGDCRGAWVTENTLPRPQTARTKARLAAETALLDWGHQSGVPVVVLRVAGIYGPGRLPIERIRQGIPVLRGEECGYTNRIHAEDLATTCLAAAERGHPGGIYNVSDGHPSIMTAYFHSVADIFGLPRPPEVTLAEARKVLSPAMLSYLGESRRLDNRRIISELGVTLRYPNLEAGLTAIAIACGDAFP